MIEGHDVPEDSSVHAVTCLRSEVDVTFAFVLAVSENVFPISCVSLL